LLVGGSTVRPANLLLGPGGEIPRGRLVAVVTASTTALGAGTFRPPTGPGGAWVVVVVAVRGEVFDGPVEVMVGWAADHGGLDGPVGGAQGVPAPDLGRQPAS